jgi:zinc transport system substrate-binding protein
MNKIIYIYMMLLLSLIFTGCSKEVDQSDALVVAVSIGPEESFVKAIAGDLVSVVTLIPSGASPTNYQPSPKEMTEFQKASVYFAIGVPAETTNIIPNIVNMSRDIRVIHLDDIVAKIYEARYFDEDAHQEKSIVAEEDRNLNEIGDEQDHIGRDPHIWMSPKRVVVMVEAITETLISLDPEHEQTYLSNSKEYKELLNELDKQLLQKTQLLTNKTFVIMHPSLGYFADDYNLNMVAIEQDGKQSTAAHLQEVIDFSLANNIKAIFYQAEFDSSQAKTLATEINGEVLEIDTLSTNYLESMYSIADMFDKILK